VIIELNKRIHRCLFLSDAEVLFDSLRCAVDNSTNKLEYKFTLYLLTYLPTVPSRSINSDTGKPTLGCIHWRSLWRARRCRECEDFFHAATPRRCIPPTPRASLEPRESILCTRRVVTVLPCRVSNRPSTPLLFSVEFCTERVPCQHSSPAQQASHCGSPPAPVEALTHTKWPWPCHNGNKFSRGLPKIVIFKAFRRAKNKCWVTWSRYCASLMAKM